jgi:small multidrug resistance family-3 protein
VIAKSALLLAVTAVAEIAGCFLPYLWLRKGASPWLLIPAALSLALFAWLLTLHPSGAGRTYAAYGGVYVAASLVWLWLVEGQLPNTYDLVGVALCLAGTATIIFGATAGR